MNNSSQSTQNQNTSKQNKQQGNLNVTANSQPSNSSVSQNEKPKPRQLNVNQNQLESLNGNLQTPLQNKQTTNQQDDLNKTFKDEFEGNIVNSDESELEFLVQNLQTPFQNQNVSTQNTNQQENEEGTAKIPESKEDNVLLDLLKSLLQFFGIITKEEESGLKLEDIPNIIEKSTEKNFEVRNNNLKKIITTMVEGEDNYNDLKEKKLPQKEIANINNNVKSNKEKLTTEQNEVLSYIHTVKKYETKNLTISSENFDKDEANLKYANSYMNFQDNSSLLKNIQSGFSKNDIKKITQKIFRKPLTEEKRILQLGYIASLNDTLDTNNQQQYISDIAKLLKNPRSVDKFNDDFENYKIEKAIEMANARILLTNDESTFKRKATISEIKEELAKIEEGISSQISSISKHYGISELVDSEKILKNQYLNPFSKYKGSSINEKLKKQDKKNLTNMRKELKISERIGVKLKQNEENAIKNIIEKKYGTGTKDSKGYTVEKEVINDANKHFNTINSFMDGGLPGQKEFQAAIEFFKKNSQEGEAGGIFKSESDIRKLSRRINSLISSNYMSDKIQKQYKGIVIDMKQGENFKNSKNYTKKYAEKHMNKNKAILQNASKDNNKQKLKAIKIYNSTIENCDPRTGKASESGNIVDKISYSIANASIKNKMNGQMDISQISETIFESKNTTPQNNSEQPTSTESKESGVNLSMSSILRGLKLSAVQHTEKDNPTASFVNNLPQNTKKQSSSFKR